MQQMVGALLFVTGILTLMSIGVSGGAGMIQEQAIERGYALHCPETGEFAWADECGGK